MMDKSQAKIIKEALTLLNVETPFANFDITFSSEELDNLKKLRIDLKKSYNNFAKLEVLSVELIEFIRSLGKNDVNLSKSISDLIKRLVNVTLLSLEKETAWVSVRASTITDAWDVPRWHTDGYYYSPYNQDQYKVVITLKGPSTLYYPLPNSLREKFNSLQFDLENRDKIANMLDSSMSISAAPKQGTIYIVGSNHAAVHSEPPIHVERLFLSILPGNKPEIEEVYNNWHRL